MYEETFMRVAIVQERRDEGRIIQFLVICAIQYLWFLSLSLVKFQRNTYITQHKIVNKTTQFHSWPPAPSTAACPASENVSPITLLIHLRISAALFPSAYRNRMTDRIWRGTRYLYSEIATKICKLPRPTRDFTQISAQRPSGYFLKFFLATNHTLKKSHSCTPKEESRTV